MFYLKACQRCAGDMLIERNVGVTELVCIQCGSRQAVFLRQTPVLQPAAVRRAG